MGELLGRWGGGGKGYVDFPSQIIREGGWPPLSTPMSFTKADADGRVASS